MASQAVPARWSFGETVSVMVILIEAALLAALLGGAYYFVNLHRVSDACTYAGDSYSFSVTDGFTCRHGDGRSESKFWW